MEMRDFGESAEVGDYLITGDENDAGRDGLYGLGEDYVDMVDTLLSARGLVLAPDHRGLRAVRK
jgi:hypothetical protein